MSKLVAAAIQMQPREKKQDNLSRAEALLDIAVEKGAKLIALPELFNFIGDPQSMRKNAEPVPGPTADMLCEKAGKNKVYILGGSLAESIDGTEKIFNTSVFVSPAGKIIARYRKIHLFDVEMDKQVSVKESAAFEFGSELVTAETEFGVVGMSICYDVRFPELYRGLTLKGARIIFVPAAFMMATGKDHWDPLLRARAIENQVFIIAPDAIGAIPGTKQLTYGRSAIIDPWGTILAKAPDSECVITAELDFDYLSKVRRELPSLAHRQPEAYR